MNGTVVALVVASSICGAAHADTTAFRCRSALVQVGDTPAAVLEKCGEPAYRARTCQIPFSRNANGQGTRQRRDLPCVDVDEWTYKPGYGQFVTTLRFEENRLQDIAYGDRQ